uniref:Uncharacterized protein n=1 Tax=Graphocephala atropunctata TaxID=36148 RepID=A0A1B6MP76_9HEMI
MIAQLFYLISFLSYLNAAPCRSYKFNLLLSTTCSYVKPTTTTCKPDVDSQSAESSWDYWSILQPLMLAIYITLAALLVLLLLSCICRMCSQLFLKCGCDTWFRPCFCFDTYTDSNCSLMSDSRESYPDAKSHITKHAKGNENYRDS